MKEGSEGFYTYQYLIDILNGMYDENQVKNQNSIDWIRLQKEATESIIKELWKLENDTQRVGFLNYTLKGFFDNGKDYNLDLAESKGVKGFENGMDFQYVHDCKLVLNGVIMDVSEACIQYDGVDFPKIIKKNIRTYGADPDFVYYANGKPQDNPQKTIIGKEYLTLIHSKYKDVFLESIDSWIERFVYPNKNQVNPISIDKQAVHGSNRLILLAILATIQTTTMNTFDFNRFVLERFGIKNFEKAKSDHKEKREFINVKKTCNDILKK